MYSDSKQETMLTNRESLDITLDKLLAIMLITAFFTQYLNSSRNT